MGNGDWGAGWGFPELGLASRRRLSSSERGKWQAVFDSKKRLWKLWISSKPSRWQHDVLQANLLATGQELQQRFAAGQIGMMLRHPGLDSRIFRTSMG